MTYSNPHQNPEPVEPQDESWWPLEGLEPDPLTADLQPAIPPMSRLAQWKRAKYKARQLTVQGRERIGNVTTSLSKGAESLVNGLAPLMLYAEATCGAPRPQTLVGMTITLQTDVVDASVIDPDGDVAEDSLLFAVLEFLEETRDQGLDDPAVEFRGFLDEPALGQAWQAIRALLIPTYDESTSGSLSQHSVTATPVTTSGPSGRDTATILRELDAHIGLKEAKAAAHQFVALTRLDQARQAKGLPTSGQSRHMVFLGNPGTGKTMLARTIADLLASLHGNVDAPFVEADRSMLLGEWLGSSAIKTRHVAEAAYGGVLFIDEAYSLVGGTDTGPDRFAQEAIDTLVKLMEDERERLTVILAGYPEPMKRLLKSNPGLASRIGLTIQFPDYGPGELLKIFLDTAESQGYHVSPEASLPIVQALHTRGDTTDFGNARTMRTLFESSVRALALRLTEQHADLTTLDTEELTTIRLADTIHARQAQEQARPAW